MSKFTDDSLGAVMSTEGGGARATTPQMKRTTSRRQRQTTPQRAGSAPRASSANKVSALAKASFDSQSCNRSLSRTAGRKKQQKWENDNLFGLNMFMKRVDALNRKHYDSDEEEDDEGSQSLKRQGISLNWQSLFSTLTNGENEDALETYLKCSNSYRVKKAGQSKTIKDCYSEWDRAEFAWLKVEKRLRTIVLQALGPGSKEAQEFVSAVESLLLSLEGGEEREAPEEGAAGSELPLPTAATHLFPCPPRLVLPCSGVGGRMGKDGSIDKDKDKDKDKGLTAVSRVVSPHLVVTLLDSAFHRLLLHATCQFHMMHSKSYTTKRGRATKVSAFQSSSTSEGCHHSISLVPFVLLKISTLEEERQANKLKSRGAKGTRCEAGKENYSVNENKEAREDVESSLSGLSVTPACSGSGMVDDGKQITNVLIGHSVSDENDETDESDGEGYCLVDMVASASSGGLNPIESRELH